MFTRIINFYLRYQNINLKISFILISLQLLHLYWLTTDVVIYRLTGIDYFIELSDFILLFIIIDYIEIPALVSGITYYFFALIYDKKEKEKRIKNTVLLILLAIQSIHIFWITDEIVYSTFVGSDLIYMPEYFAWIAILIDYLELPVIYDLLKRIVKKEN
ncbi:MAG TPA: hypothetical protein VFR65_02360 [Nitrososphaeraceae archaeon]|nr:hypothetical protein [Nitrososphaeraceae archaeon]